MLYNESNSFLFVNATKPYQFKANNSEIKNYPLCLGTISGDFSAYSRKKKGLHRCVCNSFVDCRAFNDAINIIDIHKYLMKQYNIK